MATGSSAHRVVIVGGGFAGLEVARLLQGTSLEVTLVDRRNFHLFQPLLYQVATGGLSPANISAPLRSILRRGKNVRVLLGEVIGLDPSGRRVLLADGDLAYDSLVIATGVTHHYFGNDRWASLAPGLKSIEDATEIRRRILFAFESAERETSPAERERWLRFVVIGAGPTGVELAGAIGELARHTLKGEFRRIDSTGAQIILLEGLDRVLSTYPESLSRKAEGSLECLGVSVRTGARVTDIQNDGVTFETAKGVETIPCRTVLWAAGVQASPLGQKIAEATGAELDRAGRVVVEADCSLRAFPDLFVIGDLARFEHDGAGALPGVASVAMQQGAYVARLLKQRVRGETVPPFHYRHPGSMATIGRAAAVAEIGPLRFGGFLAWLAWLLVHLVQLIGFQNRVLVLTQWAWNYWTRNRAARLITGSESRLSEVHVSERET